MEQLKMLRHIEEVPGDLSDARDGHIDQQEARLITEHYAPQVVEFVKQKHFKDVCIISSQALRSMETSQTLKNAITEEVDIPVLLEIDPRSDALSHGKYREGVSPDHPLVKRAKHIYITETFVNKNPWYRYGDVLSQGESRYPELDEIFESPGESQAELNIRIYRMVLELLDRIESNPEEALVLSTHYVVMSRILGLQEIAKTREKPLSLFYLPDGNLYLHEWDSAQSVMQGYDFHEFFKVHNYIFDIDLNSIQDIRNAIESDLDIYLSGYMQRYGKTI